MSSMHPRIMVLAVIGTILFTGCGPMPEQGPRDLPDPASGKADTGWISNTSYELGAVLESELVRQAVAEWQDLAVDRALQEQLIDTQIKYAKQALKKHGYEINQLAFDIRRLDLSVDDNANTVTLRYAASIDMVKHLQWQEVEAPGVEDLPQRTFGVPLPLDPIDVKIRMGERCAADWDPYYLMEYNYYYYFHPEKEGCDLDLHDARLTIEQIYPRKTAFPEYDRLLKPIPGEADARGFSAALFPTRGDDDPESLHQGMKRMLEQDLGLEGAEVEGEAYRRYRWTRDGATMLIDLYDPTKLTWINQTYQEALGRYQLVHYAGHSNYGTNTLLTDASKFSDGYQVFMMWSCHSYAYYARQVFRAKATAADPTGFAAADFVGTAPTPFFGDEAWGVKALLAGLMDGIAAVSRGEEEQAPPWQSIIEQMNRTSMDRPYGAAGARTNVWQPEPATP